VLGPILAPGVGAVRLRRDTAGFLVLLRPDLADLDRHRPDPTASASDAAISSVLALPPRSRVTRSPSPSTRRTAFSTACAASGSLRWRSSIAAESTIAVGLASPFPAMSGALPWTGS